jgi:hypothetical protein
MICKTEDKKDTFENSRGDCAPAQTPVLKIKTIPNAVCIDDAKCIIMAVGEESNSGMRRVKR